MTTATPVLTSLAAASSSDAGSKILGAGLLVVLAAVVLMIIWWARPRLREQRHKAWEKAGLLPEQLEPEGTAQRRSDDGSTRDPLD
ncbi:hypothetical protein [Luteipulveratus halotolerans]|uniref:hypothetical protein n=1 Tax=Luteipulveratus halotolerans TaxID=1631356 RepID=UPI0012FBFF3B|nr:hypothetical protein [Luteipulveratus halotolerans]